MNLFWRIFLTFWLALMAVSLLGALGFEHAARREALAEGPRGEWVRERLRAAAGVVERTGPRGLRRMMERRPRADRALVLVDRRNRIVMGRLPPDRIRRLAAAAREGDGVVILPRDGAAIAVSRGDESFVLMAPWRRSARLLEVGWRGTAMRVLLASALSALVAWLLSRHIVRPLRSLQATSRSLASGDLSVRARAEDLARRDELGDLARDFDRMAERLQGAQDSERRLLADASHELRSPIARLQVAVELARQRAGNLASAELDRIETEAERLNDMIGQVLELARDRDRPVAQAPVDLIALIEQILGDVSYEQPEWKSRLAFRRGVDSAVVAGDEQRLRSVIENLVRNAVAHSPDEGVVDLSLRRDGKVLELTCRDQGPGVPDGALSSIFEPFYTRPTEATVGSRGHGLGLAIVAAGVVAHGGEISAENAQPSGLSVRVRLPETAT